MRCLAYDIQDKYESLTFTIKFNEIVRFTCNNNKMRVSRECIRFPLPKDLIISVVQV